MAKVILRKLGKRGRTTIPDVIRQMLDYRPGDLISFTVNEDDSITLRQEFLCHDEACPIQDDFDEFKITPESVLDDFSDLSPADQFQVMSRLVSAWAAKFNH